MFKALNIQYRKINKYTNRGSILLSCVIVLLTGVLGLPQSIEIFKRPDKKFRQGFIGAPAAVRRSENK